MTHKVQMPQIVRHNLCSINVCVPEDYTDLEAIEVSIGGLLKEIAQMKETGYWETMSPDVRKLLEEHTDTSLYRIAKPDEMQGDPERAPCERHPGYVHMCVIKKDDKLRKILGL